MGYGGVLALIAGCASAPPPVVTGPAYTWHDTCAEAFARGDEGPVADDCRRMLREEQEEAYAPPPPPPQNGARQAFGIIGDALAQPPPPPETHCQSTLTGNTVYTDCK